MGIEWAHQSEVCICSSFDCSLFLQFSNYYLEKMSSTYYHCKDLFNKDSRLVQVPPGPARARERV